MARHRLGGRDIRADAAQLRVLLNSAPVPSGGVDHGSLAGLTDDDHPQYLHTSAARTVTAQHTFNASGAPFLIGGSASGTLVSGLNADLLDGHHEDYFVPRTRHVDSGTGLLGGGTLEADRTISVNQNYAFVWGARHTFNAGARITADQTLEFGTDVSLSRIAENALVMGAGDSLRSNQFLSGPNGYGWRIESDGTVEFQNAYIRGELYATVFVKGMVEAHAGTMLIGKSAGKLELPMAVPAGAGVKGVSPTWNMTVSNPPGGGNLFDVDDILRTKADHPNGVGDTWCKVIGVPTVDEEANTQTYPVVWMHGSRGVTYPAGYAVLDYGQAGQGLLTMTADWAGAPYYDVETHGGEPWDHTALGNALGRTHLLRLGNLSGVQDEDVDPSGYGLYSSNAFLKGKLVAGNGSHVLDNTGLSVYQKDENISLYRFYDNQPIPKLVSSDRLFIDSPIWVTRSIEVGTAGDSYLGAGLSIVATHGVSGTIRSQLLINTSMITLSGYLRTQVTNNPFWVGQFDDNVSAGTGDIVLSGDLLRIPEAVSGTQNIGSAAHKWNTIYVKNIVADFIEGGTALGGSAWVHEGNMIIDAQGEDLARTISLVNSKSGGSLAVSITGTLTVSGLINGVNIAGHVGDTTNPHVTTLEQARQAGSAFAGNVSLAGYRLTDLGAPTDNNDAARKVYVDDGDQAERAYADSTFVKLASAGTITARHTFNPGSASSPFILGANAQGQLVSGLNADLLDGLEASAFLSPQYLVLALNGSLTNERRLVIGAGLTGTDGGAGGDYSLALATPGTLSVGSANSATSPHTHAITSSSDPGEAASLLSTDVSGLLTLYGLTVDSDVYVGGNLLPQYTDVSDLGSATRLWRKGWLSELESILFVENTVQVLGGWFWIPHGQGTLAADVDDLTTTIDIGANLVDPGDILLFRGSDGLGGGKMEYMRVDPFSEATGEITVERDLDGTGANEWPEGHVYVNLGGVGDGRIEFDAQTGGPQIRIVTQGADYYQQVERGRFGDLSGWKAGVSGYGWAVGDPAGSDYAYYSSALNKLVISGEINAGRGQIGGWTLGANSLSAGNTLLHSAGYLQVGSGEDVAYITGSSDTYRIWVGASGALNAPFRVTKAGVLQASGASISGIITAESGSLGNLNITGTVNVAETGSIAAGAVRLSNTGVSIAVDGTLGFGNSYSFRLGANAVSFLGAYAVSGWLNGLTLQAVEVANTDTLLDLRAQAPAGRKAEIEIMTVAGSDIPNRLALLSTGTLLASPGPFRLFFGGVQMGDFNATDTDWFRINQNTEKNIFTPRTIRAGGGYEFLTGDVSMTRPTAQRLLLTTGANAVTLYADATERLAVQNQYISGVQRVNDLQKSRTDTWVSGYVFVPHHSTAINNGTYAAGTNQGLGPTNFGLPAGARPKAYCVSVWSSWNDEATSGDRLNLVGYIGGTQQTILRITNQQQNVLSTGWAVVPASSAGEIRFTVDGFQATNVTIACTGYFV